MKEGSCRLDNEMQRKEPKTQAGKGKPKELIQESKEAKDKKIVP